MKSGMILACAVIMVGFGSSAQCAETDQYTGREVVLKDSRDIINQRVNEIIQRNVRKWRGPRNDFEFSKHVRTSLEGFLGLRRFNFWLRANPEVEFFSNCDKSIYRNIPFYKSLIPVARIVSGTVVVNGNRIGLDKFSHMFTVGWSAYKRYVTKGEREANEYGVRTERGYLGLGVSGVFSNADLVANYEGRQFYRSLSEDGVVPGKPALISWNGDRPSVQRAFDIADHVTPYFDEALNTSQYLKSIKAKVLKNLRKFCAKYQENPEYWEISPELDSELAARYSDLGLVRNFSYRLSAICR